MDYYADQLKGKTIYCNADDYRTSNFVRYFHDNFEKLALRRLIATNYDLGTGAYLYEYDGLSTTINSLKGNGDFRSDECVELLDEADIVITNPPFSRIRDFFKIILDNSSHFLFMAPLHFISYKCVKNLVVSGSVNTDFRHVVNQFAKPDGSVANTNQVIWITDLTYTNDKSIVDYAKGSSKNYEFFDEPYDYVMNVDRTIDIPLDYDGLLGVPISYMRYHDPAYYKICDISHSPYVSGHQKFSRVIIQKRS